MDGIAHRLRHVQVGGHRLGQLQPRDDGALLAHEHRLVQARPLQGLVEQSRLELPLRVLEALLLVDRADHRGVGHAEAEIAGLLVERRLGDELRHHLPLQAEHPRLLRRQRALQLHLRALELGLIGLPELLRGDRRLAHGRHRVARPAAEELLDAEDPHARDQQGEDHRQDDLAEPVLAGVADTLQHCL